MHCIASNNKLTCPAAIRFSDNDTQEATGNNLRGRVRCSAGFGVTVTHRNNLHFDPM